MPRARRSRPTPLPHDAAARLRRTVAARLSAALDDPELVAQAGALCVPWLLADRARLRLDKGGRLRLAPEAGKAVKRLTNSLARMTATPQAHGQQAAAAAAKTVRALRTRRVDWDGLLDLAAAYRAHRLAYRKRYGSPKAHAPVETVMLDAGAMVATRMVSEQHLARLGHKAGNCLADPEYRKDYLALLKAGRTEFWRIDPADGPDAPVWAVALASGTGLVEELEHVGACTTLPRDRDALLEFLATRARIGPAWEDVLAPFALSPELVAAARDGAVRHVEAVFAGARWRFEVGTPGVLAAVPVDGPGLLSGTTVFCWMLHGAQTGAGTTLAVEHQPVPSAGVSDEESDEEDEDTPRRRTAGPRTMLELTIRLALRDACRVSPALRTACREAFAAESPLFVEDWFGSPRR